MIAVAAFWCLPRKYAQDGFAATTAFGLFLLFPFSAIWLVGSVFVVQQAIVLGNKTGRRGLVTGLAIVALGAAFLASRESEELFGASWTIVGIAYFTLRHIHVLIECYLERINAPTIRQYARYHLLMPVLFAGPIHRLPHFERQCERRRWSAEEFFSGAERALFGFALAVIGGEFLGGAARELLGVSVNSGLGTLWIASMIDWVRLYAQFAGLTSIALGLCLMIGLRLEENFNQPWRARNLVDFWSRWHMTLSFWCRDYVYFPVAASLRSPVAGVFCAMLVLGLWHESSWNYLFWAVYQAIGIVVSQIYLAVRDRLGVPKFPELVSAVVAPLAVLGWLASAKPVIARLVEALGL
jgi:alginate O-acetyltransferase complex protein AlgI